MPSVSLVVSSLNVMSHSHIRRALHVLMVNSWFISGVNSCHTLGISLLASSAITSTLLSFFSQAAFAMFTAPQVLILVVVCRGSEIYSRIIPEGKSRFSNKPFVIPIRLLWIDLPVLRSWQTSSEAVLWLLFSDFSSAFVYRAKWRQVIIVAIKVKWMDGIAMCNTY